MARALTVASSVVVTAILTSAFWIFYKASPARLAADREVTASGEKVVVDTPGQPAVTIAEGVTVGPAGLVIPVAGVKPSQLSRHLHPGPGRRAGVHDAIDIMAPRGTPVVAAAPTARSRNCSSAMAAAASPPMSARPTGAGSIITPISMPTRRGSPRASARAAAIRSAPSAAPATPAPTGRTSISRSTAWRRASTGSRARPINPYPLLAGQGPPPLKRRATTLFPIVSEQSS